MPIFNSVEISRSVISSHTLTHKKKIEGTWLPVNCHCVTGAFSACSYTGYYIIFQATLQVCGYSHIVETERYLHNAITPARDVYSIDQRGVLSNRLTGLSANDKKKNHWKFRHLITCYCYVILNFSITAKWSNTIRQYNYYYSHNYNKYNYTI